MDYSNESSDITHNIRVPAQAGKYQIVKTIGKGGFAVVVLGINPQTKEKVAIKIVDRKYITEQNVFLYLENELRLASRFNHPNIVKVLDVIYEPDIIMVVMEYFQHGDLQTIIAKGVTFTIEEQIRICLGLLSALEYLHERGIAHRDIKPENILFDNHFEPKIIDFGLSKENSSNMCTYCGTPLYMAPEVITSEQYDGRVADIWALGIVLHILSVGRFPWEFKTGCQFIKEVQENRLHLEIMTRGVLGKVIEKCLEINPAKRSTAKELIEFVNYSEESKKVTHEATYDGRAMTTTSLPHLKIRHNTPLMAKPRKLNEKGFGKVNFFVRRHNIRTM